MTHIDAKRSRSTELTGGEGFTYEDTIVAYYLTALLHETAAAGIAGTVVRVAVQQASQGEPLDDLVVDTGVAGQEQRLSVQVKRQLTISAAESNADFRELVANALKTRAKPGFRAGSDRYGFIARTVGDERLISLQRIISRAQASTTGAEFAQRFATGGEASQADIDLRNEVMGLLTPTTVDDEADFYRHFVAVRMDGFDPAGDRYTEMANRLGQLTASGPHEGPVLADALCRQVRIGEGAAKVWTRPTLLAELRQLVRLKIAPSYAEDIAVLTELARTYVSEIRQDIGGTTIDRSSYVEKAWDAARKFKLTNISGLPGCGKSVVLRCLVERALDTGPVLFLKADRLTGNSWRVFATSVGLQHRSAGELLAEIGASGTPVLFIDGIDRVKPEHRPVITNLLHAIDAEPALAHWHVVVSSRDQGLEPFRQWIPASVYRSTGIGNVAVGLLDDTEAELLAAQKPQLRRLLFGADAVQEIARRPFFAAVLAEQFAAAGTEQDAAPQTENELIAAWWKAGGYNAGADAVLLRQRAIIDFAEAGAPSLGKAIAARVLQPATIAQVTELRRDHVIDVVEEGSVFSFAHDIFFEWAYFRLLIDRGAQWREAVIAAGEPPLLARIVGLLSQHVFETNGSWSQDFEALAVPELRPQWRRAWLLGPPASQKFLDLLSKFESLLLANNNALLSKFLVWFQAERTIPNPLVLNTAGSNLDGAALIRAADLLGWPSDLALWNRVLLWIFARQSTFPASAVPHAVELFAVFQNMLGDLANPMSRKLIEVAETWLAEIVQPRGEPDGRQVARTRWDSLTETSRKSLIEALRQLILRSGRAYPDAARRVVDRAIDLERRPQELLEAIVAFSPILAEVCPERLAELVRVDVLEQLPRDEMEEEQRERDAHFERLKTAREKPKAGRSDLEHRMLASSMLFVGEKTYNFDDIGVNKHHGSFYPPTARHQPFASLFDTAPVVARTLVCDIANHATKGWQQIHEINAPRHGTPLPLDVDFPWGRQRFWGDARTYAWYLGEGGPQPLEAAFLALTYWAHKGLDAGRNVDDLIREVVEGHDSWSALGLAVSLALEKPVISETVLALLSVQRLWQPDMARQVQNPGRHFTIFGLNPRDQMTIQQREACDYLEKRLFRQRSLRDLTSMFALGSNTELKTRLRDALEKFPNELPYGYEEEKGHAERTARLLETARIWAAWGDPSNYKVEPVPQRPGAAIVTFQAPEHPTEEFEQKRLENAKSLADFTVIHWADLSLQNGRLEPQYELRAVVEFARSRDTQALMEVVSEAGNGATQTCVAAVATVVVRFSDVAEDVAWGWSILGRISRIADDPGALGQLKNRQDPRNYLIAAHFYSFGKNGHDRTSSELLLTLAGDANPNIAQTAMLALLRLRGAPGLTWIAAVMSTELFCDHEPMFEDDGQRNTAAQADHRTKVTARALARLRDGTETCLAAPPAAWINGPRRRPGRRDRDREVDEWQHPPFDLNPGLACELIPEFPIESWMQETDRRDACLAYLDQLVGWTVDRLFPAWASERGRRQQDTELNEWLGALADIVGRVSSHLPAEAIIARFVEPFSRHDDDGALEFIADLANSMVCRHVYDAVAVTDGTLAILNHCLDRLLKEQEFVAISYRAGEVRGSTVPRMIRSLLLVSVKDASGAARFANGKWSDLPVMLPLIDRLMQRAGWSTFVMDTYLTLCERAAAALPTEAFTRHVEGSLDVLSSTEKRWTDSTTPARIAGVVQVLADANHPLTRRRAHGLLQILDRLVDMGDRRAAALQLSEHFRGVQLTAS